MTPSIDTIFKHAVDEGASDIHLMVGKPPIIRIDGLLKDTDFPLLSHKVIDDLISSMLNEHQREIFLSEKEFDFSYELPNVSRFRVNLHVERGNPALAARVVSARIPTMEDLLMPEVVYELVRLPQGLILVTGPTGCGKSTSLAAMVNLINAERRAHIITLEDPIEFLHTSDKSIIKQRQYGTDFLSFAEALKHVLRQDPNVIMVGEMRDLETVAATITLAETGHLVLATLHTLNAAQTVDRIIDIFPPYQQTQVRLQLSLSLRGVISQQLLPKKGAGRVASREILINNPAVSNLIRENKIAQIKSVIQTSAEDGMVTMDQDLKRLYKERVIEHEVAVAHMLDPHLLD
ncbi:MAG: type IV pilus twitching motility protein PilT [Patescibacteria group bacterium]